MKHIRYIDSGTFLITHIYCITTPTIRFTALFKPSKEQADRAEPQGLSVFNQR